MADQPKLHSGDQALIKGAQTGEGLIELTPTMIEQMQTALRERTAEIDETYPKLVESCPYEMKLAVAAWVIRAIVDQAKEGGGSFRHLIYTCLGFGPDAYVPLYLAGGMTITNELFLEHSVDNADQALIDQLNAIASAKPVGEERTALLNAMYRFEQLALYRNQAVAARQRLQNEVNALAILGKAKD